MTSKLAMMRMCGWAPTLFKSSSKLFRGVRLEDLWGFSHNYHKLSITLLGKSGLGEVRATLH
jgi:hypothetical protein